MQQIISLENFIFSRMAELLAHKDNCKILQSLYFFHENLMFSMKTCYLMWFNELPRIVLSSLH